MSNQSNPFRARTLSNQPAGSAGTASLSSTPPLQVNTKGASGPLWLHEDTAHQSTVPSTQKHVNFASPPAVPISPASYPSSPESTRQSPGFAFAQPELQDGGGYGLALNHNPFQEQALNDEDDLAIAQALQNARINSESITTAKAITANQANVRDTLSRFSSTGRRPVKKEEESAKKPAMDVNAFTRLLLTGESGGGAAQTNAPQPGDASISSADTSSTTLDSAVRPIEATPRSSSEHERPTVTKESRRPPPPPRPRSSRGESHTSTRPDTDVVERPKESTISEPEQADNRRKSDIIKDESKKLSVSSSSKKPPPPPLARRKSQKTAPSRPDMQRSGSSRYSLNSESDEPPSPSPNLEPIKMAPPPPPPSRRPNSQYGRRPSMDLPATQEEEEEEEDNFTRSSMTAKRTSQSPLPPPPVPPPRKGRVSGRSSVDSQHRPSMSALGLTSGSARSSSEYTRPESRNVSGTSGSAQNILADLEALRQEVDAARASAGR